MRCGLAAGIELERPLLRRLRGELIKAEALTVAARSLRQRDLSRRRLEERLERAGVAAGAREEAVAALVEAGAVDDARLAVARAATLAGRGWGDAAIAARLEGEGIPEAIARVAIAELPSETERATRASTAIADTRKAWTLLTRRGFALETLEAVLGPLDEDERGGLG